jgi:RHS repeat-associated protein
METYTLTQRELQRIAVISDCVQGRGRIARAAQLLDLSPRHIKRLKRRYRQGGEAAMAHASRGRPSPRRLTSVTDAATHGNVTTYAYDTEDNLTSIKDALNHTTSFAYDSHGRVTTVTFPSTLYETYVYDAVGNLTKKTDRKGNAINYQYDPLSRLTQKSYPDTTTVAYTYDAGSRLTQVVDPTGTYSLSYDGVGRLTGTMTTYSFLTGRNLSVAYTYDAGSNRATMTDAESGQTSYAYDTLNRLQTLTPASAISSGNFGISYDSLSRRTQMTRPNNVNTAYSYDTLSRLLSVQQKQGSTVVGGATYTYDSAGNRLSRADRYHNTTASFCYDAATTCGSSSGSSIYQLTKVTQSGSTTESYTYDAVGNRTSSLGTASYNYNSSNEMTSTSAATYTYDNNGNQLTKTAGSNVTTNTWDFENRLVQVSQPGTPPTVTFKYDPFGRRVYKSSSSGTSIYVYDGDNQIEEVNASGTAVARYTQGLGIDEPLVLLRAGVTSYYHADGLGSVNAMSLTNGSYDEFYRYDSFGVRLGYDGNITNPFQYTARERDDETSLYFYRARYYDPSVGRFLSEDPSRAGVERSLYDYTDNGPVNWSDPEGLEKAEVCCRGLNRFSSSSGQGRFRPLGFLHHCYIQFLTDANVVTDSYGVVGNPGSTNNQIPRHGNGTFEDLTPGQDPQHPTADRNAGGKCKGLPATSCQLQKLREGLDTAVRSGTCPSCGANYHRWSNNSNTFAYNMIAGAGIQPPGESWAPGYHLVPGPWY